jgi:hypothetical protein
METMPTTHGAGGPSRPCRLLVVAAVLAVAAMLAVGCGGLPSNRNQANQNSDTQALKFAQCMQQHGVDVKVTSDGHGGGSIGIRAPGQPGGPSQQQVVAAQQACKQYQPNGGQGSGPPSAQQLDQNTKYVQCMNQHGVPARLGDNGSGVIMDDPTIPDSKLQQAQQACQKYQGSR